MPDVKPYGPGKRIRLDRALYKAANRVYFLTIGAYQRREFFCQDDLNECVLDALAGQAATSECRVFTYCLMPNHLHFLVSPERDGASVLTFVDRFKGKSTNRSWSSGHQGKLWEPRCYDHIVRKDEDLAEIARYILENPVRKGLCACAEAWPWSGQMNPLPL